MIKPLLMVVAAGIGIGLLVPTGEAPAPADPASAKPTVALASASPMPTTTPAPTGETLLQRTGNAFYVNGSANNQPVHFVVDTGASVVALTVDDARRIGIPFSEGDFAVVGRGASGDVMGKEVMLDSIEIEGKRVSQVRAIICQGLTVSLLGQTYLSRISAVQMNGDYMVLR